jgi:hypothetical protein
MSPVPVRDPANIDRIFGPPSESRLSRFGRSVFLNGVDEVILFRISGKEADGRLYGLNSRLDVVEGLKLRSLFGGEKYNEINVEITNNQLIFNYEDFTKSYDFKEYPNLGSLSYAINKDAEKGENLVYTHTENNSIKSTSLAVINDREITLSGGRDGLDLTKNEIYIQLNNAYDILSDYPAEIYLPIDAYIDDTYPYSYYNVSPFDEGWYSNPHKLDEDIWLTLVEDNGTPANFGKQLIRFCKERQDKGLRGIGVIGTKPAYRDSTSLRGSEYSHIGKKLANPIIKNSFNGIADNYILNNLYLLSIVGSDAVTTYSHYGYEENGAINYASLVSKLSPGTSTTNKSLENTELPYEYEDEELIELDDMKYVVFKESIRKGLVPVNGTTFASQESGLHYLTSVRILQGVLNDIKRFTDPMIGEPIRNTNNFETIDEEVEKILSENNNIKNYDYDLIVNDSEGYMKIKLEIELHYEINKIKTNVRFNIK